MKRTLSYAIVFCLGLIFASSGAFASVGDVIEARFAKYTIKVDGVVQELEADPLNYQGSVYVPLRVFANMLGKDVGFAADTKTIELNTPISLEKSSKGVGSMNDFRDQPVEVTLTTIKLLKQDLQKELDPATRARYEAAIAEREAYLESLGDYEAIVELDKEIAKAKNHIVGLMDALPLYDPDPESETYVMYEMQQEYIRNAESKLADLEAQKAALEAQQ